MACSFNDNPHPLGFLERALGTKHSFLPRTKCAVATLVARAIRASHSQFKPLFGSIRPIRTNHSNSHNSRGSRHPWLFLKAFWSLKNGLDSSTITKARFPRSRAMFGCSWVFVQGKGGAPGTVPLLFFVGSTYFQQDLLLGWYRSKRVSLNDGVALLGSWAGESGCSWLQVRYLSKAKRSRHQKHVWEVLTLQRANRWTAHPEGPARQIDVSRQKLSPHCLEAIFDSQLPSPKLSPKMPPELSLPHKRGLFILFQN